MWQKLNATQFHFSVKKIRKLIKLFQRKMTKTKTKITSLEDATKLNWLRGRENLSKIIWPTRPLIDSLFLFLQDPCISGQRLESQFKEHVKGVYSNTRLTVSVVSWLTRTDQLSFGQMSFRRDISEPSPVGPDRLLQLFIEKFSSIF